MSIPFQKRKPKVSKNLKNMMFADFSEGLYLLDTPRDIAEQLGSLALTSGVNVYSEKGALIPQYGYSIIGRIPDDEEIVAISKDSLSATSFYILTLSGTVYLYTAFQGIKKFKTLFNTTEITNDILVARKNNDLIIYFSGQCSVFGNFYRDGDVFEVIDANSNVRNFGRYFEAEVSLDNIDYYWNNKKVGVQLNGQSSVHSFNISNMREENNKLILTLIWEDLSEESPDIQGLCSIGEKTLLQSDLIYYPEEETERETTIVPKLLEVCHNRLFVVDYSGNIFYSQVGIFGEDETGLTTIGFREEFGAGYFGGFYNDSSEILSIEEYSSGALITRKNGMYFLSLANNEAVDSTSISSQLGLSIVKVSDIGQEYATDHVIVDKNVYAYDASAGSLTIACTVTIYGTIMQGSALITADYLNAQNYGIADSRRCLVFNKEAQVFILYYGDDLRSGLVISSGGNLFPRKLNKNFIKFQGLNQGVVGIAEDRTIVSDFKKGTIVPEVSPSADFEAIALKDNRCICASILEVTELNGIEYDISVTNALTSYQHIKPYNYYDEDGANLPLMLYSSKIREYDSFALTPEEERLINAKKITEDEIIKTKGLSRWVTKKSNCTRIYAPMSGREGITISLEFKPNVSFCMAGFRLLDFSQGE